VTGQGIGLQACARLPPAWPVLAGLDHWQFGRVFVLSIAQGCRGATTAPASSRTWKAIAGQRARAKARQRTDCRSGLP
jgi:hypothetical protein